MVSKKCFRSNRSKPGPDWIRPRSNRMDPVWSPVLIYSKFWFPGPTGYWFGSDFRPVHTPCKLNWRIRESSGYIWTFWFFLLIFVFFLLFSLRPVDFELVLQKLTRPANPIWIKPEICGIRLRLLTQLIKRVNPT